MTSLLSFDLCLFQKYNNVKINFPVKVGQVCLHTFQVLCEQLIYLRKTSIGKCLTKLSYQSDIDSDRDIKNDIGKETMQKRQ